MKEQLLKLKEAALEEIQAVSAMDELDSIKVKYSGKKGELTKLLKGMGKLLLADDTEKEFVAGDIVRFADKDVHGLLNDGNEEFIYVSVTAPPINFGYAYKEKNN